uniref:Lipoprotein n=1 Tax=Bactrocera dorsalis TaxID=27457 RepID=A0A034V079_BACDO
MLCKKFIFVYIILCSAMLINASFAIAGCGLSQTDNSPYLGQTLNKDTLYELLFPLTETTTKKPRKRKGDKNGNFEVNLGNSENGPEGNFSVKGSTDNSTFRISGHGSINRNNGTKRWEAGFKGTFLHFG